MLIQGKEVPKVHILMQRIDDMGAYIDSKDGNHPDLQVWLTRYEALWQEFLNHRRIG